MLTVRMVVTCTWLSLSLSVRNDAYRFCLQNIICDGLRNKYSVERRTTQQLVATHEEIETIITEHVVCAKPADLDVVLGSCGERHRVNVLRRVVGKRNARSRPELRDRKFHVDWLLCLNGDRLGVRTKSGDSHASARNRKIRKVEDLARLPCHLALLLGVLVIKELVYVGDYVEGERMRKDRILSFASLCECFDPLLKLTHTRGSSTARCLVGRHDTPLDAEGLVQRCECHQRNGSGAVWIGDQPLGRLPSCFGVNLGHDKRDCWVIPKR
mmetsp:Transcript_62264/g.103485  ORF Transcript_62264/g.103485 Transcript_62264/m.103485 type:complete len:270 (+) Transcript_62264:290-1099(+)